MVLTLVLLMEIPLSILLSMRRPARFARGPDALSEWYAIWQELAHHID
ncbi:hypothetical protein [Burkholderia plantarii]|nr:hypothetical protein [Burkholderia plantarii]